MSGRRIVVYDTTLRDGAQGPAVSFSSSDKARIARALDGLGFTEAARENDRHIPADALQQPQTLLAVHDGHARVENHQRNLSGKLPE